MFVAGGRALTYVALSLLGPSVCALLIVGLSAGRGAVRTLMRRVLQWRAPLWAWIYAVVGNGLLVTDGAIGAVYRFGGGGLDRQIVPLVVTVAVDRVPLTIGGRVSGGLGRGGL